MKKTVTVENAETKISVEQFIIKAIKALRNEEKSPGIHSVFSGFNQAFRSYYPELNPIEETKKLNEEGRIIIRPAHRGVMIYLPDADILTAKTTLAKMGL